MYQSVSPNVNFVEQEKKIEAFWEEEHIFEKSIESRKKGTPYVFYDGPPTANGKPHIGHVLTRVIKDMIPRYRTMKGYMVPRKAGWDTHGLPVELEVEKKLGLDGKDQIEKYGLEPFIAHCKESVWQYKGMWEDFSRTVGFWADMDNPYVTYDNDYIESEWWALKSIYDRGLLYKGYFSTVFPGLQPPHRYAIINPDYLTKRRNYHETGRSITGARRPQPPHRAAALPPGQ